MKNPLTFLKLDYACLEMAKLTDQDLNPSVRQQIINNMSYKICGLLDGVNDPFWDDVITLTVAADQEFLKDYTTNGGVITAITSTAITRNSGTFPAGEILNIALAKKADGTFIAQWIARVTVAGATATIATIAGTPVTFDDSIHVAYVNGFKKLSATTADISDQYVKNIKSIFDDQGSGSTDRVFDVYVDSRKFGEAQRNPHNAGRIVCLHYGNTIEFKTGSSASALGTVQAFVKGKPTLYTDATANDELSSPPEENQMLMDEVTAEFIRSKSGDIPADINARLAMYQKTYEAAAAARAKAAEAAGK